MSAKKKAAEQPATDEIPDGKPREGTQSRTFWEYAQAFARGIENATGIPQTPPRVHGPQDVLVQLLRAHCKDDGGKLLRGTSIVCEWIETTVQVWRHGADEGTQKFIGGWTPRGFSAWLGAGRPIKTHPASAVAHVQISRR